MDKHCILVVDDDPGIRIAIAVKLRGSGYQVLEAGDGVEALEVLSENDVDLAIIDVGMPRMDGYTLCEEIQSKEESRAMPVMILTAQDAEIPEDVTSRIRVDEFLTKPFSPRELVKKLSQMLSKESS